MTDTSKSGTMAAVVVSADSATFRLESSAATDIGQGRKHNEDTVLLRPDLQLYLLADGAGGHNAGNVASTLATTSVAHHLEEQMLPDDPRPEFDAFGMARGARALARSIAKANQDILEISKTSDRHQGMGTTIVAMLFSAKSGLLHLAHVGDSRCYRLRDDHIEQLTHDHSLLNDILELRPDLDDAAIERLPRNVVTRALGMSDSVRPSVRTYDVLPGDRYLLCSDGLTDVLEIDEIGEALSVKMSPEEQVKLLLELANERKTNDNIAVVVVACTPVLDAQPRISHAIRRRGPRLPPRPQPAPEASSPEIVLLPVGDEADESSEDPTKRIRFVPAQSASPEMRDAIKGLVPKQKAESKPAVPPRPKPKSET